MVLTMGSTLYLLIWKVGYFFKKLWYINANLGGIGLDEIKKYPLLKGKHKRILEKANNSLHADCHKRHVFCEKKKPQKPRPLWQPVKLALGFKLCIQ